MHMPGLHSPTQRQQEIMRRAGELAARFSERAHVNDPTSTFPYENYRDMHDAGYLRLALPTAYGGEGADVFDMVLAQEILGRGDASTALVVGMMLSLLGRVIDARAWPDAVLADICATLAREGGTINNCVTEAELGSISRGGLPAMTGERVDGGWRVTGRKIFVTGAPVLAFSPPPSCCRRATRHQRANWSAQLSRVALTVCRSTIPGAARWACAAAATRR